MPIFFQHQVSSSTRIGIWKIEEGEDFFKGSVPLHRDVSHPHKRLQHLAGRFLLRFLYPDFPQELIAIADTKKPYLPDAQYHFSISHCGDFAAAIVSRDKRVGVDIEIPVDKIVRIRDKFLSDQEKNHLFRNKEHLTDLDALTLLWSAKESVFKWYGDGAVEFREHIHLLDKDVSTETIYCLFSKNNSQLEIRYKLFDQLVLAWIES